MKSLLTRYRWDARVARETNHQARIEAAFDGAEACDRAGELERALVWLREAEALSGGLPADYRAMRAELAGKLAAPRRPDPHVARAVER